MNQTEKLFDIIKNILISKNQEFNSDFLLTDNLKEDLGLESFDMVELVVALEDEFGVDIFEAGKVETINDVLERIKN